VAKAEMEKLGFEKWGAKAPVWDTGPPCTPLSFSETRNFRFVCAMLKNWCSLKVQNMRRRRNSLGHYDFLRAVAESTEISRIASGSVTFRCASRLYRGRTFEPRRFRVAAVV
ncbi:MAG TPA: hypothetical protein VLA51_04165, partial [Paracoccaceae bacterium]|nr:hypothetical protein [Paracoccaceae bacterium]